MKQRKRFFKYFRGILENLKLVRNPETKAHYYYRAKEAINTAFVIGVISENTFKSLERLTKAYMKKGEESRTWHLMKKLYLK